MVMPENTAASNKKGRLRAGLFRFWN